MLPKEMRSITEREGCVIVRPYLPSIRARAALLLVPFILAACGTLPSQTPEADSGSPGADATEPTGRTGDVEAATIRIEATGTFVDPDPSIGAVEGIGTGSGFVIDPSGIAVTNNHVVAGAGRLEVFFSEDDEPHNATVLGVSECSDLAVIDIEGDDHPYLEWYDQPIETQLDVFAAGYPLATTEYTITEGIISQDEADGESNWASVDSVVEHTARILPGNSGGPLVTDDGEVVGVNYASTDLDQFYAIARDEALEVIEQLRQGEDVDTIGINGLAVLTADLSGVWVGGVDSGSPASDAGVEAGDLITEIEGVSVGFEGTMEDYCDVLRSHPPGEVLAIEGIRGLSGAEPAAYRTELNSDDPEPLAFITDISVGAADDEVEQTEETYTYELVSDDSGAIEVEVPVEWSDRATQGWDYDGDGVDDGVGINASTDIQGWLDGWVTPGMFFGASRTLAAQFTPDSLLDEEDFSGDCTYDGREPYDDGLYVGVYDLWVDCGGTDNPFIVVAATPAEGDVIVLVEVLAITDADLEAIDRITQSFLVVGTLP